MVNLKRTKSTYENFHKSKHEVCRARINLEIEIDCLISQMVSVIDCLLVQISNKLGLSIPLHQISIDRVVRGSIKNMLSPTTRLVSYVEKGGDGHVIASYGEGSGYSNTDNISSGSTKCGVKPITKKKEER